MEEKQLTLLEAWTDFCVWAFSPEMYQTFSPENRHYFNKTSNDIENGRCGVQRIKNIFDRHCPGRYKFNEATFTKTSGHPIE